MTKNNISTLVILIVLTASTAFFANSNINMTYVAAIIMAFSGIKFLLVAHRFMELSRSHSFWKFLLLLFLIVFVVMIVGVHLY